MYMSLSLYIYIYICIYIYIYIYIYVCSYCTHLIFKHVLQTGLGMGMGMNATAQYGQFSNFHACFRGLDSGNLKFETVRTNKQHICS